MTAYEMRIGKSKPLEKERTFTTKKSTKAKSNSDDEEKSDGAKENFVRKLKRGKGKYKGNLPFKCFNCGDVGHFTGKFPYKKNDKNDQGSHFEKNYKKKPFVRK